jgi:hypothetical protein
MISYFNECRPLCQFPVLQKDEYIIETLIHTEVWLSVECLKTDSSLCGEMCSAFCSLCQI